MTVVPFRLLRDLNVPDLGDPLLHMLQVFTPTLYSTINVPGTPTVNSTSLFLVDSCRLSSLVPAESPMHVLALLTPPPCMARVGKVFHHHHHTVPSQTTNRVIHGTRAEMYIKPPAKVNAFYALSALGPSANVQARNGL